MIQTQNLFIFNSFSAQDSCQILLQLIADLVSICPGIYCHQTILTDFWNCSILLIVTDPAANYCWVDLHLMLYWIPEFLCQGLETLNAIIVELQTQNRAITLLVVVMLTLSQSMLLVYCRLIKHIEDILTIMKISSNMYVLYLFLTKSL